MANGSDPREVRPSRRSRGQERTFPIDVRDPAVLRRELERQARDVCADLVRAGEAARTVTVKVRYRDFETVTRTRTSDAPLRDADRVVDLARQLLVERTEVGRRPVRLVGVQLSGLSPAVPQLVLAFPARRTSGLR
jgi:DNA polymerase-4